MAATKPRQPLEKLRKSIAKLPETSEKISHGAPTWWGGKKTFATFAANHHNDGRIAVWIKSSFENQEALVEAEPELFFVPPYMGPSGWLGVRLDRKIEWGLVESLLEDGYRMVAPKRALKQLDEERAG